MLQWVGLTTVPAAVRDGSVDLPSVVGVMSCQGLPNPNTKSETHRRHLPHTEGSDGPTA